MLVKYLLSTVLCCWGVAYALPAAAECVPDCDYSTCGDDGCGGSCGECDGACIDGRCVTDCWLLPEVGCCLGNQLVWCVDDEVLTSSCDKYPSCGWSGLWGGYSCNSTGEAEPSGTWAQECSALCTPDCEGRECGDDACGGLCGKCPAGEGCNDGVCCVGDCTGKQCGSDGCGGVCPDTCPEGQGCLNGECCVPNCENRECGSDGCDGSCGECEEGICDDGGVCRSECDDLLTKQCCVGDDVAYCGPDDLIITKKCSDGKKCRFDKDNISYHCVQVAAGDHTQAEGNTCIFYTCYPDCPLSGPACGDDGCAGSCGTCLEGQVCFKKKCCTPWCGGKECGNDGCGGTCGDCPAGQWECAAGECVQVYGSEETKQAGCADCACEECVCELMPWCCAEEWSAQCVDACFWDCGGYLPCVPDCAGKVCGSDGCGGQCGQCGLGLECAETECCVKECGTKECGDDGCGGSCGTCPSGYVCGAQGRCESSGGCEPGEAPGCGGCDCEFCVCLYDPHCCEYGWTASCVEICEEECGGCGPKCEPDCSGRECGTDGCLGSCGECAAGESCFQGKCCQPQCETTGCDVPDGCGGVCGLRCDLGSQCKSGQCVSTCADECLGKQCGEGSCGGECYQGESCAGPRQSCFDGVCFDDCGGIQNAGCCSGSEIVRCSNNYELGHELVLVLKSTQCAEYEETCGWVQYTSWQGSYGCGGSGEDPEGLLPMECNPTCRAPVCGDLECGPDGCGGECGLCPAGSVCAAGVCCIQNCTGKMCGPDGCGGYCGDCPVGSSCNADGSCEICASVCAGQECGPDGCGGYCGDCADGTVCVGGRCQMDCAGVTEIGCCDGDTLAWCDKGTLRRKRCAQAHNYCGWNAVEAKYSCDTNGLADPSILAPKECAAWCISDCQGRECGPDGCGSSCGQCDEKQVCSDGQCIDSVVEPNPEGAVESDLKDVADADSVNPDGLPDQGGENDLVPADGATPDGVPGNRGDSCSNHPAETGPSGGQVSLLLLMVLLGLTLRRMRAKAPLSARR